MKKSLLLLAIIFCHTSFSQELTQLKITPQGIEPIIIELEGLSASDIYEKSLNWIQETYKNPDKVLKAKIENKKIRLEGYSSNALNFTKVVALNWGIEYTLEIAFKDGKYQYDCEVNNFVAEDGSSVGWNYKNFYKKKGDLRKAYIPAVSSLEKTINDLSLSYYNYVSGKTDEEDDDW